MWKKINFIKIQWQLEFEQHGHLLPYHASDWWSQGKGKKKKRKSSIKNVHTELGKINEFGLALVSAGWLPEASHKLKSISREGALKKKKNPIWIDPRVVWYLHSSGRKRLQLAGFSAAFRRQAGEASERRWILYQNEKYCCRTFQRHWNLLAGKR